MWSFLSSIALALQIAAPTTLYWDQSAPTVQAASAYVYTLYVNGLTNSTLTNVSCTGTASPYTCTGMSYLTLSQGSYNLTLTAHEVGDGTSGPSLPYTLLVPVSPYPSPDWAPKNVTITPAEQ